MGNPYSADQWIDRAQAALDRSDLDEARRCWREALECEPAECAELIGLGRIAALLQDHAGAREAYRRAAACAADPLLFEAEYGAAIGSNGLGEYADAIATFERILPRLRDAAHPLYPNALYGLACARYNTGRAADAARLLEECVTLRFEHREAWHLLAKALRGCGRPHDLWRIASRI